MRFSEKRLEQTELTLIPALSANVVTIVVQAFAALGLTKSRAESSRLIKQGSVQLDSTKLIQPTAKIALQPGQILRLDKTHAVRVG